MTAQKAQKKADKQFELKAYELSIDNYETELKTNPTCMHCIYQIAEAYRLTNQNVEAAIWYRKLKENSDTPADYFKNFGSVMKKMGQYDKASELFQKYYVHNPKESETLKNGCDYAKELLSDLSIHEVSLYPASSKLSDFAPSFYKDRVVFTSFRKDFKRDIDKENISLIDPLGPQLFTAEASFSGDVTNTSFLRSDLDEDFSIVSINFAKGSTFCALTRSEDIHPGLAFNEKDTDMSIYLASVDNNGHIHNEIPFPFNEVGSSTAFPTLNEDANIIYFSSNRAGGLGGYDLYVSYLKDGSWTYPENLGEQINTSGNEITPYYDGNELWYASDLQLGLGGYDLFVSQVENGKWIIPKNLGNGVNSPEDDLFCIKHPVTEEYYVSSNRLGGRGAHDIYVVSEMKADDTVVSEAGPPPAAVDLDYIAKVDEMKPTTNDMVSTVASMETNIKEKTVQKVEDNKVTNAAVDAETFSKNNIEIHKQENLIKEKKNIETVVDNLKTMTPPAAIDLTENIKEDKLEEAPIVEDSKNYTDSNVSLVAAKKVSSGDIILSSTPVYFIQLAAIFSSKGNAGAFTNLSALGSLYKIYEGNATKIKLGYFYDEFQAKSVLSQVREKGYKDAFITFAPINTNSMELIYTTGESHTSAPVTSSGVVTKDYKIRLVSYEDPTWFDLKTVDDLGTIEQWSKGTWTIFVLSGFKTYEDAEAAKIKAFNRGYVDSVIVVDNNGVLEKINRN